MKSFLALILSFILVVFAGSAQAGEKGYIAGDKEELYGTWINMNYTGLPTQKRIIKPDGTFELFSRVNSVLKTPTYYGKYLITGKWNDAQGNIWYKYTQVHSYTGEGYLLLRISNSGNTLEYVKDHEAYPKKIDPKATLYRKYARE
jgi:hypothetical protein